MVKATDDLASSEGQLLGIAIYETCGIVNQVPARVIIADAALPWPHVEDQGFSLSKERHDVAITQAVPDQDPEALRTHDERSLVLAAPQPHTHIVTCVALGSSMRAALRPLLPDPDPPVVGVFGRVLPPGDHPAYRVFAREHARDHILARKYLSHTPARELCLIQHLHGLAPRQRPATKGSSRHRRYSLGNIRLSMHTSTADTSTPTCS